VRVIVSPEIFTVPHYQACGEVLTVMQIKTLLTRKKAEYRRCNCVEVRVIVSLGLLQFVACGEVLTFRATCLR